MASCSTWHVRLDMVEDEGRLRARARLVGSPIAMIDVGRARPETIHDLEELLGSWRSVDELAAVLAEALAAQHQRHTVSEDRSA